MKAEPNCPPPFLLTLMHPLCILGQRRHQLMAPPLPMGPYKARAIGLSGAAVGSLVLAA